MTARRRGEKGAILMVSAFVALGSLLMAALVMDLGEMRLDRRINKSTADVAARAGISQLAFGPWSGVCKARQYLLGNSGLFTAFDAGTEQWSNAAVVSTQYVINPCASVVPNTPDATPCSPNTPSTWAKLHATAAGGQFTIDIQSGYVLPDPAYPSDADLADSGATEQGSCDNLAVTLSQRVTPAFARIVGSSSKLVKVRSVGRLNATETLEFIAALQLLDRNKCNVLQTGGSFTRVIAQPYGTYPGTIQIDSKGDASCPSPIINGQSTTGGPSIVACSANSTQPSCRPGTGNRPSRIGVYAANFPDPGNNITGLNAFGTKYGDTKVVPSPRTGRKFADRRYRANVAALDQTVKSMVALAKPPGCGVTNSSTKKCTDTAGVSWLVFEGPNGNGNNSRNCDNVSTFFTAARQTEQYIWIDCDLTVASALNFSADNSVIVITGSLAVSSTLTIKDPRKVYVGAVRATGNNAIGVDFSGSTTTVNINLGAAATCAGRTDPGHANVLVVGNGSFKGGSGSTVRMCQTFVYMASGFDKVPATDGTVPCLVSPCTNYTGTFAVSSGATIDMTAPNEITGQPDAGQMSTHPFEDLGLWTEAGGNTSGLTGGAETRMRGVYFLPNADSFNLAGNGDLPIDLSAQFIADTLKVSGNATVNLVPNPDDSIPITIYTTLLVR